MAGFKKAKGEQAALKIGIYGPPGSGKTFTSLLMAEGLARATGKSIAYVDTERGTDFYCQTVITRRAHPEGFEFDALYSKSITEVLNAVRALDCAKYGVIVLDSITHIWEACINSYSGRQTSAGTIPMHAWGKIKKPYKELMSILLSSNMHVIICGRQGTEYATDEETDELKSVGFKMKAEGETPYEPHILLRMEAVKARKSTEPATIVAFAEKDRTGVLAGRSIQNPTFENLCAPILPLLGSEQAKIETSETTAAKDAEALTQQERDRQETSKDELKSFTARLTLCKTIGEVKAIGKEITKEVKDKMTTEDVANLRERYLEREKELT